LFSQDSLVKQRKAIESLYTGACDVYEFNSIKDPQTKINKQQEVMLHMAVPCRVSFSQSPQVGQSDGPGSVTQVIKLFTAPEIEIRPGSKIVVTQNGRITEYGSTGQPAVYNNHQEITMEIFKGWS
jgi:hypothetical protein